MGKHSKKRARKKARAMVVTHRALALAQKARREAEVAVARANRAEATYCPQTDIEKLNASVDDTLGSGAADAPMGWYAVRCAPTSEKKVLAGLRERRVSAYLPCEKVWARHHTRDGKRVVIERPLLVGYLFVALPGAEGGRDFAGVRKVSGVESFVGIGGEPRAIREREISALRQMDRRGDFDTTASPFSAKQQLKIVQGIFAGLVGEVVAMKGDDVVRLMLGYKIVKGEHDFPAEHLVPADPVKAA